jgi:GTP-binding protein
MTAATDSWRVLARGELQLAVLIETMRREGFELAVGKPVVLFKQVDGVRHEPMELAVIDVDTDFVGPVTEKLGQRRGVLSNMVNKGTGRTRLEFKIPSRGLIGYRAEFMTDTRGTGLIASRLLGYEEYKGEILKRTNGVLLSDRGGKTTAYALNNLEPRGRLFVRPAEEVYAGQVVGEHAKEVDLIVNCCRDKKLTNVRSSGTDEAIRLTPVRPMSLEFAMEWISDDELVEVTPRSVRIRSREMDLNKRRGKKEKDA